MHLHHKVIVAGGKALDIDGIQQDIGIAHLHPFCKVELLHLDARLVRLNIVVHKVKPAIRIVFVAVVKFGIEHQFFGIGQIKGIHTRDKVEATLGEFRFLGGFAIRLHQQDVRYCRSIRRIGNCNGLCRGIRLLIRIIKVFHCDLHVIFTIGQRETLLVDESAQDQRRIGCYGTIEGFLGEIAHLVTLFEDGLNLDSSLELTRFKLLINHRRTVKSNGILDKRGSSRNIIGGGRKERFHGLVLCNARGNHRHTNEQKKYSFHSIGFDAANINKKNFFDGFACRERKKLYFCSGDMAEWSIAAVLKTVKPKGFGGSNPSVSAAQSDLCRFSF